MLTTQQCSSTQPKYPESKLDQKIHYYPMYLCCRSCLVVMCLNMLQISILSVINVSRSMQMHLTYSLLIVFVIQKWFHSPSLKERNYEYVYEYLLPLVPLQLDY